MRTLHWKKEEKKKLSQQTCPTTRDGWIARALFHRYWLHGFVSGWILHVNTRFESWDTQVICTCERKRWREENKKKTLYVTLVLWERFYSTEAGLIESHGKRMADVEKICQYIVLQNKTKKKQEKWKTKRGGTLAGKLIRSYCGFRSEINRWSVREQVIVDVYTYWPTCAHTHTYMYIKNEAIHRDTLGIHGIPHDCGKSRGDV